MQMEGGAFRRGQLGTGRVGDKGGEGEWYRYLGLDRQTASGAMNTMQR